MEDVKKVKDVAKQKKVIILISVILGLAIIGGAVAAGILLSPKAKPIDISFKVDGEIILVPTKKGMVLTPPNVEDIVLDDGGIKQFDYWLDEETNEKVNLESYKAHKEITFLAVFKKAIYNVALNFGEDLGITNSFFSQGDSLSEVNVPVREGFIFAGWYKDSALTEEIYILDVETTLYAKWLQIFSVSFFAEGSLLNKQSIMEGRKAIDPSIKSLPIKSSDDNYDYTFDKWLLEGDVLFEGDVKNYFITGNTTFTASFTSFSKAVSVSFLSNFEGASNMPEPLSRKRGEKLNFSPDEQLPFLYGHFVKEWRLESGVISDTVNYVIPSADYSLNSLTITVVFAKKSYSLQIFDESGTPTTVLTTEFGNKWTEPQINTPLGHKFVGWYECQSEQLFDFETTANEDNHELEIYPKFTALTYSISWNLKDDGDAVFNPNTKTSYTIVDDNYEVQDPDGRKGYTFKGWYNNELYEGTPITKIAKGSHGHITLYAKWQLKTIVVTFYIEANGYSKQQTCLYNQSIDPFGEPSGYIPTGHSFSGWFEKENGELLDDPFDFDTPLEENLSLYAKLERLAYSLTLNYNYDSVQEDVYSSKLYDDLWDEPEPEPEREHYDFAGWYKEAEASTQFDFNLEKATKDVTIYAHWVAKEYTMSFYYDTNKESLYDEISAVYNNQWTKPSMDPQKDHYTFDGWFLDTSFNDPVLWNSIRAESDIAVYAQWKIKQYKLTLNANDGVFSDGKTEANIYANYGSPWETPSSLPTRAEYTFGGWYYDKTFENAFDWDNTFAPLETQTALLYAKWDPTLYIVKTYYSLDDFINTPSNHIEEVGFPLGHDFINDITIPPSKHYLFDGWYEVIEDEEPVPFNAHTMPNRDLNLFATWTPKQYSLTFNTDGGSSVQNLQKLFGSTWDEGKEENWAGPITTKNHFNFIGWFEKFEGEFSEDVFDFSSNVNGNLSLYAKWEKKKYKLTLNNIFSDEPYEYLEAEYQSSWSTPENPEETGYNFLGWKTSSGGPTNFDFSSTATSNVTVYAKWEKIEYNISWFLNDSEEYKANNHKDQKNTYNIETATFQLKNASREGHDFIGWYDNESCEGSPITEITKGSHGDITLYAKWETLTFDLTLYIYDGLTNNASYVETLQADYDSYWTEPEGDPIKESNPEHYSFLGWLEKENGVFNLNEPLPFDFSNTKAKKDREIYAYFKPNEYTLTFDSQGGDAIDPLTRTFNSLWWTSTPIPGNKEWVKFIGWKNTETDLFFNSDNDEIATADLELIAVWEYIVKIYFRRNGGSFDNDSPNQDLIHTYTYDYPIDFNKAISDITKLGYDFKGWYELDEEGEFLENPFSFKGEEDKFYYYLYAKWETTAYTITYECPLNDPNLDLTSYNLPDTYTIESPTIDFDTEAFRMFVREGKVYDLHFYFEEARETRINSIPNGSYGNRTLYLNWVLHSFTIDYSLNLTAEYESSETIGDLLEQIINNLPRTFTNESGEILLPDLDGALYYEFTGWKYIDSVTTSIIPSEYSGDIRLWAQWAPIEYAIEYNIPEEYNLILNPNPSTYNIESDFTLLSIFVEYDDEDLQSLAWFTDEDLESPITEINAGTSGNLCLWAEWVTKFITVYFETELSDFLEGNTHSFSESFDYNKITTAPPEPIQNHYIFLGWYELGEDEPFEFGDFPPENDFTLWAKWNKKEYQATFYGNDADQGDLEPAMTVWGELIEFPSVTKAGFTFGGWFLDADFTSSEWNVEEGTMPQEDISFYAKWVAA